MSASLASRGTGQVSKIIVHPPSCAACRIELAPLVTLGGDSGLEALGEYATIKRDRGGRFYIADRLDPASIKVFDRAGRFLRPIGRQGRGPGEAELISFFHLGPRDSVGFFDAVTQRYSVLSPDWRAARTHSLRVQPVPDGSVGLDNGDLIISGVRYTSESVGFPLHRFSSEGEFRGSFGSQALHTPQTAQWSMWHRLAVAPGNRVWATRLTDYSLELWTADGVMLKELQRRAEWFHRYPRVEQLTLDRPPRPVVFGVREDAGALLWVLVRVADARWRQAVAKRDGPEGAIVEPIAPERVFDTVVEVIDPESGTLIASQKFDAHLIGFIDSELVYGMRTGPAGHLRYDVWRISLKTP